MSQYNLPMIVFITLCVGLSYLALQSGWRLGVVCVILGGAINSVIVAVLKSFPLLAYSLFDWAKLYIFSASVILLVWGVMAIIALPFDLAIQNANRFNSRRPPKDKED